MKPEKITGILLILGAVGVVDYCGSKIFESGISEATSRRPLKTEKEKCVNHVTIIKNCITLSK
jgi:hypothetical protein